MHTNSTLWIPMDPNTFLGSVGGMILRVKSLLRRCVDLYLGKYIYIYINNT